jgi:serine/threonine protein kinase
LIGQTLAHFRITAKLGEGGMGSVHKADDLKLHCEVVIKTPHAALIKDAEFASRFRREIRSLLQLSHAHIVKVMDVGVHNGLPFAVMQYLPGGSLEVLMTSIRDKFMPLPDETIVYSGHGPATTIGQERQSNPFILQYLGAQ